ncbi:MAG: YceI family protein [Myxococcales bacterium]
MGGSAMEPASFDASTAECLVFTYKAGLLAGVAHDLKLRVERFEIAVDDQGIRARFDANSLRVACAQVGGKDDLRALSSRDRREIEATIARDVLDARRHPVIEFRSRPVAPSVEPVIEGALCIRGRERPLIVKPRRDGDRAVIEATLDQTAFGIRPYTAMLGALRIRPDVRVRLTTSWQRYAGIFPRPST